MTEDFPDPVFPVIAHTKAQMTVIEIPETFDFLPYESIISGEPLQHETLYQLNPDEIRSWIRVSFYKNEIGILFDEKFKCLNQNQKKVIIYNIVKMFSNYVGCVANERNLNNIKQEIAGIIYKLSIIERFPGQFQ